MLPYSHVSLQSSREGETAGGAGAAGAAGSFGGSVDDMGSLAVFYPCARGVKRRESWRKVCSYLVVIIGGMSRKISLLVGKALGERFSFC